MLDVLVAADDRTGALEVAGACADRTGRRVAVVTAIGDLPADGMAVVDLGSRHAPPGEAARRAAAVEVVPAGRRAHKIDSALRGNWAVEVVSRTGTRGRGVVVAAVPALGRVCREGTVLDRSVGPAGCPIAEAMASDPMGGAGSSRPEDHLRAAGASAVTGASAPAELRRWLGRHAPGVVVCDAEVGADLDALGRALSGHDDVVLAGTAPAVGAWATPTWPGERHASAAGRVRAAGRVLVVCGSVHPAARAQMDVLRAAGLAGVTAMSSPAPAGTTAGTTAGAVTAAARSLAAEAARAAGEQLPDVIVVVGGDTAAAVLGPEPVVVHGQLAPGVALGRRVDGHGPWFATRAGSFGRSEALVELVTAIMRP